MTEAVISRGVWFGIEHVCRDGHRRSLRWEDEDHTPPPREWLVCDDCGYASAVVTRSPRGLVTGLPRSVR